MQIYIKPFQPGDPMQEFEVLGSGNSRHSKEDATHFINGDGRLTRMHSGHHTSGAGCMYLHLHGKKHQFGELLYEETGDKRCKVNAGEPYLSYSCDEAMVVCRNHDFERASPVTILRVVS